MGTNITGFEGDFDNFTNVVIDQSYNPDDETVTQELQNAVGVAYDNPNWQDALNAYISQAKYETYAANISVDDTMVQPAAFRPATAIVRTSGTRFTLNGNIWRFAGTNIYGIAAQITKTLHAHAARGVNAIRIWGFGDGYGEYENVRFTRPHPMQKKPGVFSESALKRLDFVMDEAGKVGIRVVLVLSNRLKDFGGAPWYVGSLLGRTASVDRFWTNKKCRTAFKKWVRTIVNRRNTVNGRLYKEDPVILAWELMNEPTTKPGWDKKRNRPPGKSINMWIREMAALVKSLDRNHLLFVGDSGERTEGQLGIPQDFLNNGYKGFSAKAAIKNPNIDALTIHWYAEAFGVPSWNASYYAQYYIADRCRLARLYNKPCVVEEIGVLRGFVKNRNALLQSYVQAALYHNAGGVLLWQVVPSGLGFRSGPYDISYTVSDGGPALNQLIKWKDQMNAGQRANINFHSRSSCPNIQPPHQGSKTCSSVTRNGKYCSTWWAGYCMSMCGTCKYFDNLRALR